MHAADLEHKIPHLLEQIQQNIYQKALDYRSEHIHTVDSWDEFMDALENKTGFVSAHWDGSSETENKIKELSKATIRCIPLNNMQESGKCILTGNPSKERVLFARAY
jgi:prolyl-tRNA synthetase